jgi:lipoprotein signal peptidase
VIADYGRLIAFNLADVFFVVGELLLMATLMVVVMRSRQSPLPSPVAPRRRGSRQQ